MKIKNILVPVDFSPYSERAIAYAFLWAKIFKAKLTLLYVNNLFNETSNVNVVGYELENIMQTHKVRVSSGMKKYLDEAKADKIPIHYEIIEGISVANSIIEYAKAHPFDLLIMGTHGRTGLKHFLLGSVTEKVVRFSPLPVITTHIDTEIKHIKKILVPLDFSEYSKPLAANALELGRKFHAQTHFLHVLEHPAPESLNWLSDEAQKQFELDPNMEKIVLEEMEHYIPEGAKDIHKEVIQYGHAFEEIVTYAEKNGVDLIMMATRGYTKFDYFWLWGSNADRVVRLATCPVLTERRPELLESTKTT